MQWETGTVFFSLINRAEFALGHPLHPTAILLVSWSIFQNIGGSLVTYCVLILGPALINILTNNFHEDLAH